MKEKKGGTHEKAPVNTLHPSMNIFFVRSLSCCWFRQQDDLVRVPVLSRVVADVWEMRLLAISWRIAPQVTCSPDLTPLERIPVFTLHKRICYQSKYETIERHSRSRDV